MLTVILLLLVGAFVLVLVHAAGKCALWPAVLVLCLVELVAHVPLGR